MFSYRNAFCSGAFSRLELANRMKWRKRSIQCISHEPHVAVKHLKCG